MKEKPRCRYVVNGNGQAFLVRKRDRPSHDDFDAGNCEGSCAEPIDDAVAELHRVACPICGRACALSPVYRWAHRHYALDKLTKESRRSRKYLDRMVSV